MSVPECSPSGAEVKGFLLNIFVSASLDEQASTSLDEQCMSGGEGVYTEHFVSASLDEQFMREAE